MCGKGWRLAPSTGVLFGVVLGLSLTAGQPARAQGKKAGAGAAAFDIPDKGTKSFFITFEAGKPAEITVKSEKETDVDLYVIDEAGKLAGKDDEVSKDCKVTFTPARTQTYLVSVLNLGPGANRSTVAHNGKRVTVKGPSATVDLDVGASKSINATFPAGKKAEILVEAEKEGDVDVFIFDAEGRGVAKDERIAKDSYVSFTPDKTQTYRI